MQRASESTSETSVIGHLTIRWDVVERKFHLRVWVRDVDENGVRNLTPEWAEVVHLEDDEWCQRTLYKYVTALAEVTRIAADDEDQGRARLF